MRTPQYKTSQRIGTLGKRVFQGGHPDSWFEESEPVQNSDFGFDMSMLVESMSRIRGRFAVQLKAGASTHLSGPPGEQFIAVPLAPESCNLYLQDGQPILLVYVALENESSTANATLYYLWIEEELRKRLQGRRQFDQTDPAEMTFRVPVANVLTKELDVSQYLETYWDVTRTLQALRNPQGIGAVNALTRLSPRAQESLAATNPKHLDRWLINETLAGDSLWPTPKPGSAAWKIRQLNDALNHADAVQAHRLTTEIAQEGLTDSEVLAEFLYQQGRLALLENAPIEALKNFSQASGLNPASARFVGAELEAAVVCQIEDEAPVPADVIARAEAFRDNDEVAFQLVRILALEERYAEAESTLSAISEPIQTRARALYHTIRMDWHAVLRVTAQGLLERADSKAESFLRLLQLRALLNIATGDEGFIYVGGPPDLTVEDAEALRDATMVFLRRAREDNWPANAAMGLDCASAVCVYFGPDKELLELIADFARRRPTARDVHETLARVATFSGEPDVAIAALQKVEKPDPQNVARLVLLLSEADRHQDAVQLAKGSLLRLPHDELTDIAAVAASSSAYRLGSTKDEAILRAYVEEGSFAARSLLRFITSSLKFPENRKEHVQQLWDDATTSGGNHTLQDNLIQYIRPNIEEDVDRILELCRITRERRNLTQMESAKFAACLVQRGHHDELLAFTERALNFYPDDENLGLSRAIALEKIGQPSAAEQVLRRFDKSVRRDVVSARTQLLLRVGDIEAILGLTQRALAAATDHAERFHYHRTLATLCSRRDRGEYLEATWRLGEVVDQTKEEEEGAFLLHFLMATSGRDFAVDGSKVAEFQQRVGKFVERFPESAILRVCHMRDDASPVEMLDGLRELAGITPQKSRALDKMRQLGERMGSHIPFAFRARTYAQYASNLADLFRVLINAWHEGESSRLIVGNGAFANKQAGQAPIIDLTTLFVLVELELFDKLFDVWGAVAIPRESLAALTDLTFGPLDENNTHLLGRVSGALKRHRHAIVQPSSDRSSESNFPLNEFETIRSEVEAGRFEYLTADLASAVILCGGSRLEGCYSLWHLVDALFARGLLSAAEVSAVRLCVAAWNTEGVPLEAADVAAASLGAAPRAADDKSSYARAVRRFFSGKDTKTCLIDAAKVLILLSTDKHPSAAPAARWFARIFFLEALFTRSLGFRGDADELTSHLAVLCVAEANEDDGAAAAIEFIWSVLENARTERGGTADKDQFFRLLGRIAADLLDRLAKAHGLDAILAEARFIDLLFSLAQPGTQDRATLESAHFERTKQLHASR